MHRWPFCSSTTSRRRRCKVASLSICIDDPCRCKVMSLGNYINVDVNVKQRHSATASTSTQIHSDVTRQLRRSLCICVDAYADAERHRFASTSTLMQLPSDERATNADAEQPFRRSTMATMSTLTPKQRHSYLSPLLSSSTIATRNPQ